MAPYVFPTHTRGPDGRYGPTDRGNWYKALGYHNRNARRRADKSRWRLTEGQQYEAFRKADDAHPHSWHCAENSGQFSILDNGAEILGLDEERLAFFPDPQNSGDPWHGYPVLSSDRGPSPALLDHWLASGVISRHVFRKIHGGKL